jgi:hypothetical protein
VYVTLSEEEKWLGSKNDYSPPYNSEAKNGRAIAPLSTAEGEWIKLHNEELHNLYSLPSIIRISR